LVDQVTARGRRAAAKSADVFDVAALTAAEQIENEDLRAEAIELFKQLNSGELDEEQRFAATALLAEILFPQNDHKGMPGLDLAEAETMVLSR